MKRVSIFGATGSIGQNTVDLIRRDRTGFDVVALTGGRNVDLLAKSAIELGAKHAAIAEDELPSNQIDTRKAHRHSRFMPW